MKNLKIFIEAELLQYIKPYQAERAAQSINDKIVNELRNDVINKLKQLTQEELRKLYDNPPDNTDSGNPSIIL